MTATAVRSKKETQKRRERAHHWIARGGQAVKPRGYRSPIGLAGGSRLRVSDPRLVGLSAGRREYRNPAVASVDNGETPTPGTPGAVHGTRGPLCCGGGMIPDQYDPATPAAGKFDDEHYPGYTMGRAAEMLGTTQNFLRSL